MMNRKYALGILATFILTVPIFGVLVSSVQSQAEPCCVPPRGGVQFLQGAQVTVYIDMSSGFTGAESEQITEAILDWMMKLTILG
ncbi:MAG TPA: hypothetical protein VNO50_15185 [Pyrinomonadaceae bacterium]|nr:hypothetical protein [Pyrinomonadaceae bacterium]